MVEPDFFFEDVDFLDAGESFFGFDAAFNRRKFLELEEIGIKFVIEATLQASALSVEAGGVEREVLILCGFGGDVFKIGKPSRAAKGSAARADAADAFGFFANGNLRELNARFELSGKQANKFAEVDALVGGEVNRRALFIESDFGVDVFHVQAEFFNF